MVKDDYMGRTSMFGMILGLILLIGVAGTYVDTDARIMDVTLKNVSNETMPYTLYVNGEVTQTGLILPGGTAHYQYEEAWGIWHSWEPHTVSIVTPHTVHEKDESKGDDLYFVLD